MQGNSEAVINFLATADCMRMMAGKSKTQIVLRMLQHGKHWMAVGGSVACLGSAILYSSPNLTTWELAGTLANQVGRATFSFRQWPIFCCLRIPILLAGWRRHERVSCGNLKDFLAWARIAAIVLSAHMSSIELRRRDQQINHDSCRAFAADS